MNNDKSLVSDLKDVLWSPKRFFEQRFLQLKSKRIFLLGFIGAFFGLLVGSLLMLIVSYFVAGDFATHKEAYAISLQKSLGLTDQGFLELWQAQMAYSLLIAILSPAISYMAPHLFGGAVFAFLWLLVRSQNIKIDFFRVMECSAISLTSLAFYAIPGIGPIIAVVMVVANLSRALTAQYKLVGFMKVVGILSAVYVFFFLGSASLQLLALPIAKMLKW